MSIHLYGRLIIYTTCYLSHVVLAPSLVQVWDALLQPLLSSVYLPPRAQRLKGRSCWKGYYHVPRSEFSRLPQYPKAQLCWASSASLSKELHLVVVVAAVTALWAISPVLMLGRRSEVQQRPDGHLLKKLPKSLNGHLQRKNAGQPTAGSQHPEVVARCCKLLVGACLESLRGPIPWALVAVKGPWPPRSEKLQWVAVKVRSGVGVARSRQTALEGAPGVAAPHDHDHSEPS